MYTRTFSRPVAFNATATAVAACDPGDAAISGGYYVVSTGAPHLAVYENYPVFLTEWHVSVRNVDPTAGTVTFAAVVECVGH